MLTSAMTMVIIMMTFMILMCLNMYLIIIKSGVNFQAVANIMMTLTSLLLLHYLELVFCCG